ncbi:mechanosensitive ion channel [Undibacterium cyanobacteriorum]|uniref:Mechanosensitive ion channel n=1 Tax=Undibacterium cyanobacteriorum TaxID=3073561 RepID=A0ABY9RHH0_9BURK|nr:mechanosensitive ion channel domain-containing protein [Undibacterium sp. 20NA77.5]WMW79541.1 mechanosensitive ion channel [Undibacterium sp. 20NA77.5]
MLQIMGTQSISQLVAEISADLGYASLTWQALSIVLCIVIAWFVSRQIQKKFDQVGETSDVVKIGVESFSRVLWPLLALALLFLTKLFLAKYQHTALLKLSFPILSSFALIRFSFYVFRRAFIREGAAGSTFLVFEKVFAALVWIGVVLYMTGLWGELAYALDEIVLPLGKTKISLLAILQALGSVALTVVLALWISAMLEARLMQIPSMHSSLKVVLARLGRALFILAAILMSLSLVGIDLTVLSVFGGALGVGLGFGLQRITSSYVSGFIILFDRSLSIDDMITVDKYSGRVTQINTRYTVLKGLDGVESIIPNEMLVSNPVQNLSLSDRAVVLTTEFTVDYKTDLNVLLPRLIEVVSEVPRISKTIPPSSYLLRFGADGFEVRVGFWIDDPENGRTNITSEVNLAILALLKELNVELPYPHRDVTIYQAEAKK